MLAALIAAGASAPPWQQVVGLTDLFSLHLVLSSCFLSVISVAQRRGGDWGNASSMGNAARVLGGVGNLFGAALVQVNVFICQPVSTFQCFLHFCCILSNL